MPLVLSVSALLPASIHMPTVDVWAHGECSVAIYKAVRSCPISFRGRSHTVRPFERVVDSVREDSTGFAYRLMGLRMALRAARLRMDWRRFSASLWDAIASAMSG